MIHFQPPILHWDLGSIGPIIPKVSRSWATSLSSFLKLLRLLLHLDHPVAMLILLFQPHNPPNHIVEYQHIVKISPLPTKLVIEKTRRGKIEALKFRYLCSLANVNLGLILLGNWQRNLVLLYVIRSRSPMSQIQVLLHWDQKASLLVTCHICVHLSSHLCPG